MAAKTLCFSVKANKIKFFLWPFLVDTVIDYWIAICAIADDVDSVQSFLIFSSGPRLHPSLTSSCQEIAYAE
jgi:hypothetical protein